MIRDAAVLGSIEAQFYLGKHYELGDSLAHDELRPPVLSIVRD